MNPVEKAAQLNKIPLPDCLDRSRVQNLLIPCPTLFSDTRVFIAAEHLQAMASAVAAIDRVGRQAGWQALVSERGELPAAALAGGNGIFFGYDFHITPQGPKLIEINTNAGGALMSVELLGAQRRDIDSGHGFPVADEMRRQMLAMFLREWGAAGHSGAPACVAIVDDAPQAQYFLPEFELARDLLQTAGITALICDPAQLEFRDGALWSGERRVDMVYNRLTDFALDEPTHRALRDAWLAAAVVLSPHPRAYALYADKRNLVLLCDAVALERIGIAASDRAAIRAVLPETEIVGRAQGETLWARRRSLFFKPASGYGSKAVYRGQNVTRGVFESILAGNYVAQTLVPPDTRLVRVDGGDVELKYDLRCYAYEGCVQLVAARLWQGQTTNFRTPGGGFAPVVAIGDDDGAVKA